MAQTLIETDANTISANDKTADQATDRAPVTLKEVIGSFLDRMWANTEEMSKTNTRPFDGIL